MNGLCCAWQTSEQEERQVRLRKEIQIEYTRQRLFDREDDQARRSEYISYEKDSTDARRRLMATKKAAAMRRIDHPCSSSAYCSGKHWENMSVVSEAETWVTSNKSLADAPM